MMGPAYWWGVIIRLFIKWYLKANGILLNIWCKSIGKACLFIFIWKRLILNIVIKWGKQKFHIKKRTPNHEMILNNRFSVIISERSSEVSFPSWSHFTILVLLINKTVSFHVFHMPGIDLLVSDRQGYFDEWENQRPKQLLWKFRTY